MRKVWYSFLAFVLFAVLTTPLQAAWNTAQHDFQRTGYNPASSIDQARLTKVWTYIHPTQFALWSDPVGLNGRVFATFTSFGQTANQVQALDINTGDGEGITNSLRIALGAIEFKLFWRFGDET